MGNRSVIRCIELNALRLVQFPLFGSMFKKSKINNQRVVQRRHALAFKLFLANL